jgi:glutaredoxin 1
MEVIIYGKDDCTNCDKTKMLCQIKSVDFSYHTVGTDISIEDLHGKVGQPVRTLPQIFMALDGIESYVGGYDELRSALQKAG